MTAVMSLLGYFHENALEPPVITFARFAKVRMSSITCHIRMISIEDPLTHFRKRGDQGLFGRLHHLVYALCKAKNSNTNKPQNQHVGTSIVTWAVGQNLRVDDDHGRKEQVHPNANCTTKQQHEIPQGSRSQKQSNNNTGSDKEECQSDLDGQRGIKQTKVLVWWYEAPQLRFARKKQIRSAKVHHQRANKLHDAGDGIWMVVLVDLENVQIS